MFNYFKFSYYHKIDTSYFTSLFPIKNFLYINIRHFFFFFFFWIKDRLNFESRRKNKRNTFSNRRLEWSRWRKAEKAGKRVGSGQPTAGESVMWAERIRRFEGVRSVPGRPRGTHTPTMLLFDVSVRRETRIHLFLSLSFMSTRKGLLYMCALMSTPGGSPCPTLVLFNHAALPGCRQACC